MRFDWSDATSARLGGRLIRRAAGDGLSSRGPELSLRHRATRGVHAMRGLAAGDVRRVLVERTDLRSFATTLLRTWWRERTKVRACRGTVNRGTIETKQNWKLLSV